MKQGQIYRCQNPRCGCEVQVIRPAVEERTNPRCCCGAEMKKPYHKPVVKELNPKTAPAAGLADLFKTR